jgi:hypothetical protein
MKNYTLNGEEAQSLAHSTSGSRLLPDEICARLPKLGSNEEIGLEALAQVKFVSTDGNWTLYVSEFDGKDTLFGLVIGFDIEFLDFSLTDLEQASGGPWCISIERDDFFQPKTLRELEEYHRRERLLR